MRSWLRLSRRFSLGVTGESNDRDVRFPDGLVEHIVEKYTSPGELVFDPFAGAGTAVITAERMGRKGLGLELDGEKAAIAERAAGRSDCVIRADAREISSLGLPRFDLCMTSPPYPVAAAEGRSGGFFDPERGYGAYLEDLAGVFEQVAGLMNPGAAVVVEAGNLDIGGGVLTLAWDIARALSGIFRFEGETVICWDAESYGFDHSYCLEFSGR